MQHGLGPHGGQLVVAPCGNQIPHESHEVSRALIGGAKWDWWTIGGRWSGWASDYDPQTDPANQEVCRLCGGCGNRGAWEEFVAHQRSIGHPVPSASADFVNRHDFASVRSSMRALIEAAGVEVDTPRPGHVETGCNGCAGKGHELKYTSEWKECREDVMPIADMKTDDPPFAYVTPDGEWHEKAEMGWWGMTTNDKEEDRWLAEWSAARAAHAAACGWIAVVDCHI